MVVHVVPEAVRTGDEHVAGVHALVVHVGVLRCVSGLDKAAEEGCSGVFLLCFGVALNGER
eukprot:356593-Chlamydomonas_euryale.AAC.4